MTIKCCLCDAPVPLDGSSPVADKVCMESLIYDMTEDLKALLARCYVFIQSGAVIDTADVLQFEIRKMLDYVDTSEEFTLDDFVAGVQKDPPEIDKKTGLRIRQ